MFLPVYLCGTRTTIGVFRRIINWNFHTLLERGRGRVAVKIALFSAGSRVAIMMQFDKNSVVFIYDLYLFREFTPDYTISFKPDPYGP